jgi:two-component system response regulator YesN
MIVDDEPLSRLALVNLLPWKEHGYIVVGTAENGRQGIELAATARPDIVISDIKMPVMDGIEMMRALHADYPGMRFIVLTAYAEFEYAQEALRFGAVDYVMKLKMDAPSMLQVLNKARLSMSPPSSDARDVLQDRERVREALMDGSDASGLAPGAYRVAFLRLYRAADGSAVDEDPRNSATDIVREAISRFGGMGMHAQYARIEPGEFALVLPAEQDDMARDLIAMLRSALRSYLNIEALVGLSDYADRESVAVAFRQAKARAEYGFWTESETRDRQIDAAIRYMRAHYDKPIKLADVARAAAMNPTYFCTVFKRTTGEGFVRYLNALRVERAKELLLLGEHSVSEVSGMVGFDNSAYFAKVFRHATGSQPTHYRKRALGGAGSSAEH